MWYSQNDPRWKTSRLGLVDGVTIGNYGCYVTAQANLANDCGINVNVAQLDQVFTGNAHDPYRLGGYDSGDLCWDGMLAKVYPQIKFVGVNNFPLGVPADLSKLNNDITVKQILEIDGEPSVTGLQTHFVYFYDYNAKTGVVRVIDSWTGNLISLSDVYAKPADAIYKIVTYSFNPPQPQVPQAPPPQLDNPALPPAHDPVATAPVPAPAPTTAPKPAETPPAPLPATEATPAPTTPPAPSGEPTKPTPTTPAPTADETAAMVTSWQLTVFGRFLQWLIDRLKSHLPH